MTMEQGDDSRAFFRSPTLEAESGQVALPSPSDELVPMPSPAKVKEELINLRLEMWLSKGEELTALEVALKVVNIGLSSPATFRTAEIEPACALPLPGGTYYFVPLPNEFGSAPAFTKYKAWRIRRCIKNRQHGALLDQASKLLEKDLRLAFPNSSWCSATNLVATVSLEKKVSCFH